MNFSQTQQQTPAEYCWMLRTVTRTYRIPGRRLRSPLKIKRRTVAGDKPSKAAASARDKDVGPGPEVLESFIMFFGLVFCSAAKDAKYPSRKNYSTVHGISWKILSGGHSSIGAIGRILPPTARFRYASFDALLSVLTTTRCRMP